MFSYIFTDFYRVKIEIKLSKISKNILRLKLSSLSCVQVVGERSICVEGIPVRSAGANRSEHAGMVAIINVRIINAVNPRFPTRCSSS